MERKEIEKPQNILSKVNQLSKPIPQKKIKKLLSNPLYIVVSLFFAAYALLADDLRIAIGSVGTDLGFFVFTCITLGFFIIDIFLWLLAEKNQYLFSLNFIFDLISTILLIFDLGWVYNNLYRGGTSASYDQMLLIQKSKQQWSAINYLAVMRYVRFLRLTTLLKIMEQLQRKIYEKEDRQNELYQEISLETQDQGPGKDNGKQTRDINKLILRDKTFAVYPTFDLDDNLQSEIDDSLHSKQKLVINNTSREFYIQNIRRVMYLGLILIAIVPLFLRQYYYEQYILMENSLNSLRYRIQSQNYNSTNQQLLDEYIVYLSEFKMEVLKVTLMQNQTSNQFKNITSVYKHNETISSEEYISRQRLGETYIVVSPSDLGTQGVGAYYLVAILNNREYFQKEAWLGFGRTLVLILILFSIIYLFRRDSQKLLLEPFEEMMRMIKEIADNPMTASRKAQEQKYELERKMRKNFLLRLEMADKERYETSVLINTLVKSGELLSLGFGEAGIELVMEKLKKDVKREFNKVICLFGFCDIRYFNEATEELREDVMKFVNEIAEIVSTVVDKYTGSTNKNIGECFLLVWKFRESEVMRVNDYDDDGVLRKDIMLKNFKDFDNPVQNRCEIALLSFLEIIIKIYQSPTLNTYKTNYALTKRIPNFKVNMGFGLHIGWGIEGAIGSEHKIDASYLSPNVNLASRLMAACKQFGVNILISGEVFDLISPEIQSLMRNVDVVNLKGSKKAMRLYTYDMFLKCLPEKTQGSLDEHQQNILLRIKDTRLPVYIKQVQYLHEEFFNNKISSKTLFFSNQELLKVRRKFTKDFYDQWGQGFNSYILGNWKEAKEFFERTRDYFIDDGFLDGPSQVLLSFLEKHNYEKEHDWNGVRHLFSK